MQTTRGLLCAALTWIASLVLGCGAAATCEQASSALLDNINGGMNDSSLQITTAFLSTASNLQGPPVVELFEDPVWVAARVPGTSDLPALWLAEKAGHGFVYVANDAARAVSYLGTDLGGPPLDGNGKQRALDCAAEASGT